MSLMSTHISPAIVAVFVGSLAAVLLFAPAIAISYRRHGALSLVRLAGWAALLLWVVGIWAYTLLPVPSIDEVRCTGVQLQPGAFLGDIGEAIAGGSNPILNRASSQVILNVLLFVPLGVILRLVFGQPWWVAVALGFGASLLVELTQLTGVWGLYPCAYRLFDVDDLLANTIGATLGWLGAWAVTLGRRIDTRPRPAHGIRARRRVAGMGADLTIAWIVAFGSIIILRLALVYGVGQPTAEAVAAVTEPVGIGLALAVHATVLLTTGATIGEHAVLLRGDATGRPAWLARPIRLLAGIGGYLLLAALAAPWSLLSWIFVVVSLVAVGLTRNHRGLAAAVAGMELVDGRPVVAQERKTSSDA